jgi:cell division protein ZapA
MQAGLFYLHKICYSKKEQMKQGENSMDSKRSTEVLIDGKIYALGGSEEESYIHRLASYINEMIITLKHQEGFTKQSAEYQNIMIQLNMADDYFKAREQTARLEQQKAEMEKEIYSLKHELVATQMKLESAKLELVETRKSADSGKKE